MGNTRLRSLSALQSTQYQHAAFVLSKLPLEVVLGPDAMHGGMRHARGGSQRAGAPELPTGQRQTGLGHDFLHCLQGDGPPASPPRTVQQARDTVAVKALRPAVDAADADAKLLGKILLSHALGTYQHDADPFRIALGGRGRPHPALEFLLFGRHDLKGFDRSPHGAESVHKRAQHNRRFTCYYFRYTTLAVSIMRLLGHETTSCTMEGMGRSQVFSLAAAPLSPTLPFPAGASAVPGRGAGSLPRRPAALRRPCHSIPAPRQPHLKRPMCRLFRPSPRSLPSTLTLEFPLLAAPFQSPKLKFKKSDLSRSQLQFARVEHMPGHHRRE